MENIKIITVQRKSVLDKLQNNGVYYSAAENYVKIHKSNLFEPYLFLARRYKYRHFPIFACVEGYRCEYYGIPEGNDLVLMELSVPENEINIQYYYDWTDLIYFTEFPKEWNTDENGSLDEFQQNVLFGTFFSNIDKERAVQCTLERFRSEWLVSSIPLTDKFNKLHNGSGGANILQGLSFYKEKEV